ncbi:MAG: hypothetical protein E6K52_08095, partial [Gammaproteobacteria bacterium]
EALLSHWTLAATLSHPHLIRVLETGRCQLGGLQFVFVVMEYAEQTLSQILLHRALTPEEVREMLLPTLDALDFLHRKNLVHGRLKPSNILVVDDHLKLASDTIRPAGESAANPAQSSVYEPPEATDGSFSAAGDIWRLGITMVEALTQHPPAWPDTGSDIVSLPMMLPPTFEGIVRQCLNRSPVNRPTVADLKAQITRVLPAPLVSVPQPPVSVHQPPEPVAQPLVSIPQPLAHEVPGRATPPRQSPRQRVFVAAIAALLAASVAVWAGLRLFSSQTPSQQAAAPTIASSAKTAQSEPAPARPVSPSSPQPAQPLADRSPAVLHEEIPHVPRSARDTIHGHIKVTVRVTVDSAGNVVQETLETPGPSRYFARLATRAARRWKFAPVGNRDPREWLLRFEFTRGGTSGHAARGRKR